MSRPNHQRFVLHALEDDFALAANRFDPPTDVQLLAAVVISCATGVQARFYRDFALYVTLMLVLSIRFSHFLALIGG